MNAGRKVGITATELSVHLMRQDKFSRAVLKNNTDEDESEMSTSLLPTSGILIESPDKRCGSAGYFKGRNFRWKKLSRFRGFWPFPRKFLPRNFSRSFIRESLFPRNFQNLSTAKVFL